MAAIPEENMLSAEATNDRLAHPNSCSALATTSSAISLVVGIVRQFAGRKPADLAMLVWCGVNRFALPS